MRSTFHGFSTALSGMNISQKALDITGQNISNMGTKGYTRQRLDLYSVGLPSYSDRYANGCAKSIGQGVGVTGVSQIRDPFLDVRFRREAAQTGEIDANLGMLEDMEALFDETQNKALGNQLGDLKTQLQNLASNAGFKEFDNIVRSSAESLANLLNQYSNQLAGIRDQEEYNFENVSVSNVNDILKNLSSLNESIKSSELSGSPALELMDQRNVLLDELSTYMDINVTHTPTEVAPGKTINIVSVDFMGKNGAVRLLDDNKYATLSSEKDADGQMQLNVSNTFGGGVPATLNLTKELTTGVFKGSLDGLNKSGVFDNPSTSSRGIGYFESRLDLLASTFAGIMNDANSIVNPIHVPGVPPGGAIPNPADPPAPPWIPNPGKYDQPDGEWLPLFGASDGTTEITSKNICIAPGWKNNEYGISTSKDGTVNGGTNADGKNDNIMKMISLFSEDASFSITKNVLDANGNPTAATTTQSVFSGTFQEYFGDCNNTLALDVKSQTSALNNHQSLLQGVADLRDSVSAVSLDEEGVNLLQFQKAFSAASRFMTTLDQALDTLINRTGTVGL